MLVKRRGRVVRSIWAACLVAAGLNHAHNLAVAFPILSDGPIVGYILSTPEVAGQIGFLVFVLASWRMANAAADPPSSADGPRFRGDSDQ